MLHIFNGLFTLHLNLLAGLLDLVEHAVTLVLRLFPLLSGLFTRCQWFLFAKLWSSH